MENTKDPNPRIRNRVLRSSVAPSQPVAKTMIGPKPEAPKHEIKVNRNDQGVESIEVVCKCGERIVIRCEYV
jgi:hypothetical protein